MAHELANIQQDPSSTMAAGAPTRVLSFRRLELNPNPAAWWSELMASRGDPTGKTIALLERTEVPANVRAMVSSFEEMAAAGEAAARASFAQFFSVQSHVQRMWAAGDQRIAMVEMKHVGIKCEGRSGPYNLLYFPHRDVVYATHSLNNSLVYILA